jgi:competence ComEA-like helix-hairpin-helix protein
MPKIIDVNSAHPSELTQLPGVAKDLAYRIVNYRKQHGLFSALEELMEVKGFPSGRIDEIKPLIQLGCPDEPGSCVPPRHLRSHQNKTAKKTRALTRSVRSTRRSDRLRENAGRRH